jgi:hypothetical protein
VPDLIGTIDLHIGMPDGLDLRHKGFITFGSDAQQFGLAFAGSVAPVA